MDFWLREKGVPVDWVVSEPVSVATHPRSVVHRAFHPNAAKLFIDFVLYEEGKKIFVQRGRESARTGLKPEGYPSNLKLAPSRMQLAEKLAEYTRRYESLFVK